MDLSNDASDRANLVECGNDHRKTGHPNHTNVVNRPNTSSRPTTISTTASAGPKEAAIRDDHLVDQAPVRADPVLVGAGEQDALLRPKRRA
jgi:hypothetical protein